jgi:hypothetical protein
MKKCLFILFFLLLVQSIKSQGNLQISAQPLISSYSPTLIFAVQKDTALLFRWRKLKFSDLLKYADKGYINAMDYIPEIYKDSIKNYTCTTDLSSYIQSAINLTCATRMELFVPAGGYPIKNTLFIYPLLFVGSFPDNYNYTWSGLRKGGFKFFGVPGATKLIAKSDITVLSVGDYDYAIHGGNQDTVLNHRLDYITIDGFYFQTDVVSTHDAMQVRDNYFSRFYNLDFYHFKNGLVIYPACNALDVAFIRGVGNATSSESFLKLIGDSRPGINGMCGNTISTYNNIQVRGFTKAGVYFTGDMFGDAIISNVIGYGNTGSIAGVYLQSTGAHVYSTKIGVYGVDLDGTMTSGVRVDTCSIIRVANMNLNIGGGNKRVIWKLAGTTDFNQCYDLDSLAIAAKSIDTTKHYTWLNNQDIQKWLTVRYSSSTTGMTLLGADIAVNQYWDGGNFRLLTAGYPYLNYLDVATGAVYWYTGSYGTAGSVASYNAQAAIAMYSNNNITTHGVWNFYDTLKIGGTVLDLSKIPKKDVNEVITANWSFNNYLSTQSIYPITTDTYDLGSFTKYWSNGYISQLQATIFAENTISAVGGYMFITKGQGILPDIVSGTTQINFGQTMTVGDFVLIKAKDASGNYKTEYMTVGSLVSGTTYNVTRDVASANSPDPAWTSGTVYVILGNNGNGRLELNAYDTPRLSIIKQGATYNAQTELIRLGDLNGIGGYSTQRYGIYIGDSASSQWMTYDIINGLRVMGQVNALSGKFGTATNYWSVGANGLTATSASGDVFINYGKTDFTNTQTGFILGYDYSASLAKFYMGSSTKYFNYDGADFTLAGGTIIGGTLQTATSGQRVVIENNITTYYNSANPNYLSIGGMNNTGLDGVTFSINGYGFLDINGSHSGDSAILEIKNPNGGATPSKISLETIYGDAPNINFMFGAGLATIQYGGNGIIQTETLDITASLTVASTKFNLNSSGQLTTVNNLAASSYTGQVLESDGTSYTPSPKFHATRNNITSVTSNTIDVTGKDYINFAITGSVTVNTINGYADGKIVYITIDNNADDIIFGVSGNICNSTGAAVTVNFGGIAMLMYNSNDSKWHLLKY